MKYDKVEATEDVDFDRDTNEDLLYDKNSSSSKTKLSVRFLCLLVVENFVIVLAFLAFWKTHVPARTDLHYEILTADNKTYPSGPLSWSQKFEALPCGKTPEEARARGCEFDMLVTAWLPPRCIDRELVDEFMTVGNWQFYTKPHAKEEDKFGTYDPDFIGSVNQTVWTTRRWHVTHCLFMFKKMNRALVNDWTTDAEAVSEPHMEHCMKTFLDQVLFGPGLDQDEIETLAEAKMNIKAT
ncbi:hypothetical protein ACMFMG_004193 [Clarireedia jacksonii]